MRYVALAADYDGTLASQGRVASETVDALRAFSAAGRKLILVTGRELDELLDIFPQIGVFDRVVAENGALLYCPRTKAEKTLGQAPPAEFVAELIRRGVAPLSVGRSIVATVTPNETVVLDTIRDFGLELQVIFNKGAVMVLPAGVNKASGLAAALRDLALSARNVAAIGDAENDHALLRSAEFGIAVANALPRLQQDADRTSAFAHGAAVMEAMAAIVRDDLRSFEPPRSRRMLVLGRKRDGEALAIAPAGCDVLVAGPSASGKSVFVSGVLERAAAEGYQYCVIDPEGDYAGLNGAVELGNAQRVPSAEELAIALSEDPTARLVVNLVGLSPQQRPSAFKAMLARLHELRATIGRPHWLVIGEAHQLFPRDDPDPLLRPREGGSSTIYVSVHPDQVAPAVLASVALVTAFGAEPQSTLAAYCAASGIAAATPRDDTRLAPAEALAWFTRSGLPPVAYRIEAAAERAPQPAKRAPIELPPDRSFYFRGPDKRLRLRAQTLPLFLQIGEGVDEDTWLYHLAQGDYSRWLAAVTGDRALSSMIRQIEQEGGTAALTRNRVKAALESFMTQ
ncbi:MAG: HAD hydrolase family protein [Burkholderiales bacterium]|nr:HAD hydrolase family protein [Burkholderiales bacterium]